jgi:hypothetical protein
MGRQSAADNRLEEIRETTSEEESSEENDEEDAIQNSTVSASSPAPIVPPISNIASKSAAANEQPLALAQINSPFLTPLTNQIPSHSSYLNLFKNDSKEWSRRWFVLRGNNLMTYRDQSEYEVLKIISMESVIDILPYGREHDILKLSRHSRQDKGKEKFLDDTMVPLTLVSKMMNEFCQKIKNSPTASADIDEVKNSVWNDFLSAVKESAMYAMEIVFVDRTLTLATSRFDLYESWLLAFMRAYLSSHSF